MRETRALAVLKRLYPKAHFQTISGNVVGGVLDVNACCDGIEVWVELKQHHRPKKADGLIKPPVMAGQPAWEALRTQAGGRCYVALMLDSDLYLLPGSSLRELAKGINGARLEELKLDSMSLFNA